MRRTVYRATSRKAPPAPVAAAATTFDPIAFAMAMGTLPEGTKFRQPIGERSLLGIEAANAAVRLISDKVAMMLVSADVYGADGRTPIVPTPTVVANPYPALGSFSFWKMVVATALMRGQFTGLKAQLDRNGYPTVVVPVPPEAVHAYIDGDTGLEVWEVAGEEVDRDDLVIVRVGFTFPQNPMTMGVIEANRLGIRGALDLQQMANDVWRNGAVPSGVVQIAVDQPTREQATTVKANWIGNLGGQRTVAVTGKNMTYTPVTWNADDAQFIESQQFTIGRMALAFGLRPEALGAAVGGSSLTYSNRQDDSTQQLVDTLMPIAMVVEQEWTGLVPGAKFVRANPEALLRPTTEQRYARYEQALRMKLMTLDEVRALEGLPPLDEEAAPEQPAPKQPEVPVDATTDEEEGGDAA